MPETIVFIHGWSVTHTDTYGGLPERLTAEAAATGQTLRLRDLWLGRYVSFRDEVRMEDLSLAMEHAVRRELADLLAGSERFGVITHSTGGPVARDWWWRHYASKKEVGVCPMSHLVMLAPANFGSALAQLGKSRVGRLKSWAGGVEPGQGVLDWLEHGSAEAWALNEAWIRGRFGKWEAENAFPFVLTGQTIDRKLYDHLNSYTGELGSDGVVRVPAANMNARLVRLVQKAPDAQGETRQTGELEIAGGRVVRGPATAFRLISGASHSGQGKGILNSVAPEVGGHGAEVVDIVRRCLAVHSATEYESLSTAFAAETDQVHRDEMVEIEEIPILPDREYVHDRTTLVIFRVHDSEGHPLTDFDLELTGLEDNPDGLPEGFFKDRQKNHLSRHVLTYFVNHDLLVGTPEVPDPRGGNPLRQERPGIPTLGLRLTPRPQEGFVRFLPCGIRANERMLRAVLAPDQTTLVDIELRRIVHEGVFRMSPAIEGRGSFKEDPPGPALGG